MVKKAFKLKYTYKVEQRDLKSLMQPKAYNGSNFFCLLRHGLWHLYCARGKITKFAAQWEH